jgi:hypothetical protein
VGARKAARACAQVAAARLRPGVFGKKRSSGSGRALAKDSDATTSTVTVVKSKLSGGSIMMRHLLLRRLLVIASGRRHRFIQLDDRKRLRALRDVDRGRQARHNLKRDVKALHRLVLPSWLPAP